MLEREGGLTFWRSAKLRASVRERERAARRKGAGRVEGAICLPLAQSAFRRMTRAPRRPRRSGRLGMEPSGSRAVWQQQLQAMRAAADGRALMARARRALPLLFQAEEAEAISTGTVVALGLTRRDATALKTWNSQRNHVPSAPPLRLHPRGSITDHRLQLAAAPATSRAASAPVAASLGARATARCPSRRP